MSQEHNKRRRKQRAQGQGTPLIAPNRSNLENRLEFKYL